MVGISKYPFWNRSFGGVWLIFLFGYFHFYAGVIFVNWLKPHRPRLIALGVLYGLSIVLNIIGVGALGFRY